MPPHERFEHGTLAAAVAEAAERALRSGALQPIATKDFEQALGVVSGRDTQKDAVADQTPTRSEKDKKDAPRKR